MLNKIGYQLLQKYAKKYAILICPHKLSNRLSTISHQEFQLHPPGTPTVMNVLSSFPSPEGGGGSKRKEQKKDKKELMKYLRLIDFWTQTMSWWKQCAPSNC
ncbi:hypothetical protein NPIL_684381 [Nephila pilipes]|uniref:Uncharacterized protein n=1 Tax=Nephila pilipes TaxID=299642 RepID=A0A8X6NSF1_NEPPI|nr:hypothetical protein NPIL_684381 [Nephila pilipes]